MGGEGRSSGNSVFIGKRGRNFRSGLELTGLRPQDVKGGKMALTTEVADGIYEIQPEGSGLHRFPLCTVYLIIDEKMALVEAGCAIQAPEIIHAIESLIDDVNRISYIILTHSHPDHVGGIGYLAQRMTDVQFIAYPGVGKLLSDQSVLAKIMAGFKRTFGEDALDRFGVMLPVAEERFISLQDGQSIPLGKRELIAIHTPGHDPYHLCFYDSRSKGIFSGDLLGAYFAEIESVIPPQTVGTDFSLLLKSLDKLRERNPTKLYFSHGSTVGDVEKHIQSTERDIENCQNIVHKGLLAGDDKEKIAERLIEAYPRLSDMARSQMSDPIYMQRALRWVDSYSWSLKRMNLL